MKHHSLEESFRFECHFIIGTGSVDVNDGLVEASSTIHHSCLQHWCGFVQVLLALSVGVVKVFVDKVFRSFKSLSCPLVEVTIVKLGLLDRVGSIHVVGNGSQVVPVRITQWEIWVARECIDDRVPKCVQVSNSSVIYFWNVLKVASSISFWVVVVYFRRCVERLVDIAMVVNDKSESERLLIVLI